MKILLLEDDKYLCGNIKQQLTKEGYIVDACNDGEEGFLLALDQGNSYDLAVIDRMLPVIDGLAIIKAMRNKKIQIPVIIITGMSELQDKIEGLDNGADDYLTKPFHISELSARIRALTSSAAVSKIQIPRNKFGTFFLLSFARAHVKLAFNVTTPSAAESA